MKILMVSAGITRAGGAEEYLAEVCAGLKNKGHELLVVYGQEPKEGLPKLEELLPVSKLIKDFNEDEFVKVAGEFRPDIVNFQNVISAQFLEFVASKFPTTVFIHDHHSYCPGNSKYWFNSQTICNIAASEKCLINAYTQKCMTRRPARAVSELMARKRELTVLGKLPLIVCNSNYVKRNLVLNGMRDDKVVVNNLFPKIWPNVNVANSTIEPDGIPMILFVGRLFKEKGADHLLKALKSIKTPWKATVVGDGWEKENLVNLAKELGISSRVEFTGFLNRERVGELYARSSVVVVPALWPEPFGLIGLEAFSFKKPVIAYNSGGMNDWLQDGGGGILVERGNIAELSSKIELLITNKSLSLSLGQRGYDVLNRRFSIEQHLEKLLEVYEKIIK